MSLNYEQAHSAGWLAIKGYAEERLVELRARLEGDLSDKETTSVRASIKELKRLLNLEIPEQEIAQNDE